MRVDHFCEGLLSQESAVHHVKLDLYRHLQRHTLAPSPSVRLDSFQQSVSLRLWASRSLFPIRSIIPRIVGVIRGMAKVLRIPNAQWLLHETR